MKIIIIFVKHKNRKMETKKRAIVIGASSGLGREVAKLLLKEGYLLGVAARREERLQELKAMAPENVEVMSIDVTAEDAATKMKELIGRLGGMDLLFYASGIGKQNRKLEEGYEIQTMKTNGVGFVRMIGEAYRFFAAQGFGQIAAITSIAGTKGLGPAPAYSATKAMQSNYLQALEQQANSRGLNILFTDIRPGFVDTDLLKGDFKYPMLLKPEPVAREIMKAIKNKEHIRVIDWKYRLLTAVWRRIPRCIWRHIKL